MSAIQKPTLVRWKTLMIMSASGFLLYFSRNNMSIIGKYLKNDYNITTIELGWVFTAFALAYAIFQIPGGVLGQKLGTRKMITGMLIVWGILSILTGLLPGLLYSGTAAVLTVFIGIRFLMGIAQAPFFAVCQGIIVNWFPIAGFGKAFGAFSFFLYFGGAAVSPIVVFLITKFGWRGSFYVSSPLFFAMAAFWWWYSRDKPEEHQGANALEVELINSTSLVEKTNTEEMHWKQVIVKKPILLITLSYFFQAYVTFFFYNWLFIYLIEEKGFSELSGGLASAIPWICAAIFALLGGYFCDWIASKYSPNKTLKYICIVALFLVAGSMYWGAAVDDKWTALFLLSMCYGFMQITEIVYWQSIAILADEQTVVASGIFNFGGSLTGIVAIPILAFLLERHGQFAALVSCSICALLAAVFWIFIDLSKQIGSTDAE